MLKELAKDFDWQAAAKRLGVSPAKLKILKADKDFIRHGSNIILKATEQIGGVDAAVSKFNETQLLLSEALKDGNLGVSGALVKTHELEYRMHGLFEKDNKQKGGTVMINIELETDKNPAKVDDATIEGEIIA